RARRERAVLRRMQLEQIGAVLRAQALPCEPRRAGITDEPLAPTVESADELEEPRDRRRRLLRAPQLADPGFPFARLLRGRGAEVVAAGAGMRLDVAERLLLGREGVEQRDEHDVLQRVRVIARVIGVQVAQHRSVTEWAGRSRRAVRTRNGILRGSARV